MKTSLEDLPASKQHQLEQIVQLIRDAANVEMIILFGSYARGNWVADPVGGYFSDYDLLVIVENEQMARNDRQWSSIEDRAETITASTGVTVNIIVHDIHDVNHQLEEGWYFFSDVKKEGIVLYDSGRFQLAEAKPKTMSQRRAYAECCFEEYFELASDFFAGAVDFTAKGRNRVTAFMLHQATENYYKCALLVFTAYRPKEHNIEKLGKQCAQLHPAFRNVFPRDTPEANKRFKLLKAAYVKARYAMHYEITREQLEELARNIAVLRERTEAACKEHIASMRPDPSEEPGDA